MNKGIEIWANRHDKCRELGEDKLNLQYVDLVNIASIALERGESVVDNNSPWSNYYKLALEINQKIRELAYKAGYEISEDKPPKIGPSIIL